MAKMGNPQAQCPDCQKVGDDQGKWHPSLVTFPKLPKHRCYGCQKATESPTAIEKPETAPEVKTDTNAKGETRQPTIRRSENLTEIQESALRVIGTHRRGTEVTGKDIANMIGLKPRSTGKEGADMRSIINALRKKGYPVCANGKGYYWPADRGEIVDYIQSLEGRIRKEQEALTGMTEGRYSWDAGHESAPPPLCLNEV